MLGDADTEDLLVGVSRDIDKNLWLVEAHARMNPDRGKSRRGFWPLALLWLPAGFVASAVVRFGPEAGPWATPDAWLAMAAQSLAIVAPCGLPLALGCRRLWRLGYRRAAWTAGVVLGSVTTAVGLLAGLLGPLAVALSAVVLSLPVWLASWWLARRP